MALSFPLKIYPYRCFLRIPSIINNFCAELTKPVSFSILNSFNTLKQNIVLIYFTNIWKPSVFYHPYYKNSHSQPYSWHSKILVLTFNFGSFEGAMLKTNGKERLIFLNGYIFIGVTRKEKQELLHGIEKEELLHYNFLKTL